MSNKDHLQAWKFNDYELIDDLTFLVADKDAMSDREFVENALDYVEKHLKRRAEIKNAARSEGVSLAGVSEPPAV